jgi:hypothetical protein
MYATLVTELKEAWLRGLWGWSLLFRFFVTAGLTGLIWFCLFMVVH